MNEDGFIQFGDERIHIRDLFFEIFRSGMSAHEDCKNDSTLQIVFDYWLKEKLNIE